MRLPFIAAGVTALLVTSFVVGASAQQGDGDGQAKCKYSAGKHDDGCLDSPGGTFINGNFFGDGPGSVRQSGQGRYYNADGRQNAHPIPWSQCGLDYPCGVISDDAHLKDIRSVPIAGCSPYNPKNNTVRCDTELWRGNAQLNGNALHVNSTKAGAIAIGMTLEFYCDPAGNSACGSAPKVVSGAGSDWVISGPPLSVPAQEVVGINNIEIVGYRINDVQVYVTGLGGLTLKNNHATIGLNTCRLGGGPMISGGAGDQYYESNTWDHDAFCNGAANLYRTPNDPNLSTIANFTANISNALVTILNNKGTIARGQYIDFAGRPFALQLYDTPEASLYSCKDAECNGHTFFVSRGPCVRAGQYACKPETSLNLSNISATAGPIQTDVGFDAAGGGGWAKTVIKYNVSLGLTALGKSSSGGSVDYLYNYCDIVAWFPEHANCFLQQSSPGKATIIDHYNNRYSVAFTESLSIQGQGTSLASYFATSPDAGKVGGYQISYKHGSFDHLVLVSNASKNESGKTMGYNARTLDQGGSPDLRGRIADMSWDYIYSDATGAYGHCNVGAVIDKNRSDGNVDLLSGDSFGCGR